MGPPKKKVTRPSRFMRGGNNYNNNDNNNRHSRMSIFASERSRGNRDSIFAQRLEQNYNTYSSQHSGLTSAGTGNSRNAIFTNSSKALNGQDNGTDNYNDEGSGVSGGNIYQQQHVMIQNNNNNYNGTTEYEMNLNDQHQACNVESQQMAPPPPPPTFLQMQSSRDEFNKTKFESSRNFQLGDGTTIEDFQQLLEEGIDINATADDGNTPLAVAAFHGDYDVCKFLVENGADPNLATVQGAPPLYWAASNGHSSVIVLLVESGADPNKEARDGLTPLICASVGGHSECVRLLLELGALPNLEHRDTQETPLYGAAQEGHIVCLTWLLEKGADPDKANRVGETPIFWAARQGHGSCVKRLLEFQANPDLSTWDKQTPLYWACVNRHLDCVQILLEDGEADANIATKQKHLMTTTPLEAAVWNNDRDCIELLLKLGADEDLNRSKFVSKWMSNPTANPNFVLTLLDLDLRWDSKQLLLDNSIRYIRNDTLLLKILNSRLEDLSRESSARGTVFLLMLDFYVYICWICCFVAATFWNLPNAKKDHMMDPDGPGTASTTINAVNIAFTIYVFIREALNLRQQGPSYFHDIWNWIDLAAVALVLTSTVKWIMGHELIGGEPQFQNIVISAGAFITLSFVGFLKSTFLPFSNFVGGVGQIMWDLVPFAIVTVIVLLVFSFMFYIQEYDRSDDPDSFENNFTSFPHSFLTIFSYFVGDPRPSEGVLDLVFGLTVVVVLLNVVIALVSSSWENAVSTSLILLCTHRLQLLRRAHDNASLLRWFGGEWWIDKEFVELLDRCLDEVREEYEFWTSYNRLHPTALLWSILFMLMFVLRPFMMFMMWLVGALSFGLMWTSDVRMYLFGIKPDKDSMYIRMERVEDTTQKLFSETKQIHDEMITYSKNRQDDDPNYRMDREIDLMHEKIDNLQEIFDRTRRSGEGLHSRRSLQVGSRSRTGSSNDSNGVRGSGSSHDPSDEIVDMKQEMAILHTKIDLVLEYVMTENSKRRSTHSTTTQRQSVENPYLSQSVQQSPQRNAYSYAPHGVPQSPQRNAYSYAPTASSTGRSPRTMQQHRRPPTARAPSSTTSASGSHREMAGLGTDQQASVRPDNSPRERATNQIYGSVSRAPLDE